MCGDRLDLLLLHPGGRETLYQQLGSDLAAIEPPLWCRLIAGSVRDRGYQVAILDSEAEGLGPDRIAERIHTLNPVLVGVVVFGHQPSASTQQMVGAGLACRAIKTATPTLPVLMVGGHVSALPERTLREEAIDFACVGEGPVTVLALLQALKQEREIGFDNIPGLVWWRKNGTVEINPRAPLLNDLDADLHGMVWDLLPMVGYRAHNWQCFGRLAERTPYAAIHTSLGCPYRCGFCCIHAPFGTTRYRMRSPARVVEEIKHLCQTYGVRTFKISDEMFVLNERHVLAICEGIVALGYGDQLNFWAYSRVDTLKPHLLTALRRAGVRWLALGIESASEHVRDGAAKKLRQQDIVTVVRQIQEAGIYVIGNYIFGLPDDTFDTMRETFDLALKLNCEFANFYCAMAYPGSSLHTFAISQDWALPTTWSGYSQHSYDCQPLPTATLSAAQVLAFRDQAFHDYFSHANYLTMVTHRFGEATRHHIETMASQRLARRLTAPVRDAG